MKNTVQEARQYRYGQWAGNAGGQAYREGYCIKSIYPAAERGMIESQCSRKIVAGSFCKQHQPKSHLG